MMDLRSIVTSVRGGDRAAVDVVGEHLAIAEATNEQTNAFIELDAEGAHARAMSVDAATDPGALRGVPVALKDLIDHVGHVTTAGSDFYRYQPIASATVVDRLEAAGAVIIGRTGLHEFAYGFSSENAWFGPVRNPWDLSLSPGGSSGGSAAAVSSGAVPVAIGTDTGGSVRVPAALCGIVGLKVTHGRVPLTGVFPLAESLDTVGPLARTVDDAAALYDVIREPIPAIPWSVDVADQPSQFTSLTGLRVGVPMAWAGAVPTSNGTTRAFDEFRSALTDLGATVDSIAAADLVPHPHLVTLSAAEAGQVHRQWFTDIDKRYGPHVEETFSGGDGGHSRPAHRGPPLASRDRPGRSRCVQFARRTPHAHSRARPQDHRKGRHRSRRIGNVLPPGVEWIRGPRKRVLVSGNRASPPPSGYTPSVGPAHRPLVAGEPVDRHRASPRTRRARRHPPPLRHLIDGEILHPINQGADTFCAGRKEEP